MHRNTRHCEVRGHWSAAEHERFIEAMALYPLGPWKRITDHVGSRSIKQVQTHAQKYQQKLQRQQRGLRKRKTKLKQPEHRVDAPTLGQFTHQSILRHAQRRVKQQDDVVTLALPASPVDATFLGFHLADASFDDWMSTMAMGTRPNMEVEVDLVDLLPEEDVLKGEEAEKEEDEEVDIPKFDAMYDPPSDWNAWQLDDLLQPTPVDMTLATDKGGHPDGSELPILECSV